MESIVPPSYEEATTRDYWLLIAPYIESSDLCSTSLVSRHWNQTFAPYLWGNPASHFGTENDRVYGACQRSNLPAMFLSFRLIEEHHSRPDAIQTHPSLRSLRGPPTHPHAPPPSRPVGALRWPSPGMAARRAPASAELAITRRLAAALFRSCRLAGTTTPKLRPGIERCRRVTHFPAPPAHRFAVRQHHLCRSGGGVLALVQPGVPRPLGHTSC